MRIARLIVLVFGIFVPLYILITFWVYNFQVEWLPYDWEESRFTIVMIKYISPALFCVAWGYWFLMLGTRIANSIELMQKTSSLISAQYIIFYGVNAVVLLIVFLIPVITPIVAVLSFASMIFNLLTSRVDWDDLDGKTQRFVKVMAIIGTIPALFCAVLIFPEAITLSVEMFQVFWATSITPLFFFIKALGIALSVGAFISLYKRGVEEYERQGQELTIKATPEIYLIEIGIVAFMLMLNYWQIEFVNVLYIIGGVFVVLTFGFELIKGRTSKGELIHNPLGLLLFVAFFLSTFLFDKFEWLQYALVIGSALIFGISFIIVFMGHPDLES